MAKTAESMYNQTNDPSGLIWVAHTGTDAVPNAVYAGKETNDRQVYVARAIIRDYLVVGKFVPGSGVAFPLAVGPPPATFQVLTNPKELVQTKWALGEKYRIHPSAIEGGFMGNSTNCIGRTKSQGNTVVGYILQVWTGGDTDENILFYSMAGREGSSSDFEILLAKNRHDSQCVMNFQFNCCASCPKKKL